MFELYALFMSFMCKLYSFIYYFLNYHINLFSDAQCKVIKPIGLSNGAIPDTAINATSQRLNYESRVSICIKSVVCFL